MPAYYRLGTVVNIVAGGSDPQAASPGSVVDTQQADVAATPAFVQEAQVAEVYGYGCKVFLDGAPITADQATDEPLQAGQMVYISQVQGGGYVIHGSVKS